MRITQGTFSYLPDLTDDEIRAQVQYAVDRGWAVAVEFTDDPHPRNVLLKDLQRLQASRIAPASWIAPATRAGPAG